MSDSIQMELIDLQIDTTIKEKYNNVKNTIFFIQTM